MAVRSQIINPILRGLGWDVENPEEVQPNVSTEEGIPDYSLLKGDKKVLFIEAKKLQILDEIWHSLLDEPKDLAKGFIPLFESLIKEGYPEYEFEQTEIEDFIKERVKELISPTEETVIEPIPITEPTEGRGAQPRKIKIGADIYEIKNSYDILVNTAEWLIKKGRLRRENCPIASGHKRNLVNIQPKHRYGNDFRAPKRLSNGLYIETHYSTASCITNARKLLERCGYHGDMLEVKQVICGTSDNSGHTAPLCSAQIQPTAELRMSANCYMPCKQNSLILSHPSKYGTWIFLPFPL